MTEKRDIEFVAGEFDFDDDDFEAIMGYGVGRIGQTKYGA